MRTAAKVDFACVGQGAHLSTWPATHAGRAPRSTRPDVDRPIEIKTFDCWAALKPLIPAWEEILEENEGLSIFSTPEWLGAWWEAFGAQRHLQALGFFDRRGRLVGLIPLYEDSGHAALPGVKLLRLVGDGSGDSDNLELILRRGQERECCRAFADWLAEHREWGVCCLQTMPRSSLGGRALLLELAGRNWPMIHTQAPNAAIPLPATWKSYVAGLAGHFRPLVTRYPQRLAQRFESQVYRCENPCQLREALDNLFTLHQRRWNLANELGSFRSYERRQFYRRMAEAFLHRGWLEFWLLRLDENVVAAQLCFRYRDTVYLLQEGFDPQFAVHKVGYALRAAMLRRFIETGANRYDFLGGFNTHKQNWGAQQGAYINLSFAAPRSLGSLCVTLEKCATESKEWLRQRVPAPVWQVLHRVKSGLTVRTVESSAV
jgi:CelD/BcsL family acetyltransferase involved in cellulose biosynthesis